jgi:predicted P-loop ATPase
MKFYWFNRSLLTAAEGVPDYKQVQELIRGWAGGLMVYRDGFRVNPYGDPDDDWLDLDRKALAFLHARSARLCNERAVVT